ncbi:hypothetical protein A9Q81_19335 [Gammaproteobacteria bacterium 42_54_T18]|nr:hypothetical protein A9Q81_19335 [Gammaproteobacteria bacterium 42_54_T18]
MTLVRTYLRASTVEQDATRSKQELIAFAKEYNLPIACHYVENVSGRSLNRPELDRLLNDSNEGEILLVESLDRLTRLKKDDWGILKARILAKNLAVVSIDIPTSHQALKPLEGDSMQAGILDAINNMMLDIAAVMSANDYEKRRKRQAEGIANKKGKFTGKKDNFELQGEIAGLLKAGNSYSEIQNLTRASRTTIAKVSKRLKA